MEDETDDRDDRSIKTSSMDKIKHLSNLIKPAKKRPSPLKEKHVPPPILTASSSNLSVSTSFLRSLTHSRSRLAQQALGTLSENGAIEYQYEPGFLPRTPLTPRTPHTPRTPRSLWYAGESDEEDIRRPSGLGHRVSTSSMPGSPYGGRYPWEVGPELHRAPRVSEAKDGSPPTEEMKEAFRFPNRSVSNLMADSEVGAPPVSPSSVRSGGRPRAVSSPTLFVSIGTKVKEKLEREMEMEKLMILGQWSQVQKPDDITDQDQHVPQGQAGPVEEKAIPEEVEVMQVADENDPQVVPQTMEESEVMEEKKEDIRLSINNVTAPPRPAEPAQPDIAQERERVMSFSLVHMFPEPPSTRPSRPSSDIGHGAITMTSSPFASSASSPATSQMAKRVSSGTMASVMTAASTATMTSLGTNLSITNGPFGLPSVAFTTTASPRHSPTIVSALPNGHPHPQPTQNGLYATPTLGTPSTAATAFTFHSFPSSPIAAPIQLPHEVLNLALSYLPNEDIASLARVNTDYAAVVRGLLYSTIDLGSLTNNSDNSGRGPFRVRKLLGLLVKRDDLTALVTKFVCHEWPEWFPSSLYTQRDPETPLNELCEEEDEHENLENTFLSATLVLALSRMTGLKELVIPSYHPFLFSSMRETTWSELKSVEFGNVAMDEEEASDMVAWLAGMVSLEKLLFPRLAEKADNVSKRSSEIAKHSWRGSKSAYRFSTQTHKRCSSCWSPALWDAKAGHGNGTDPATMLASPMLFPVCNGGCAGQEVQPQEELGKPDPEWAHPLAKYTPSRAFLPNLKVLHAPPTISSLLAASATEGPSRLDDEAFEKPLRPLRNVTINIDMTLYTGLRPTALVQGLHGLKQFGLRFGERVDRRSVEKVLIAVGAALGNGLEELHVDFVDGWAAGADEVRSSIKGGLSKGTDVFHPDIVQDGGYCSMPVSRPSPARPALSKERC